MPGSSSGEFRAFGDFDGDGDQDLVHTTNWLAWSGMTLFLNDGAGGFEPGTEVPFVKPSGVEVAERDPAVGDFDGDGDLDVAVDHNATFGGDGIEIFAGDGAGGFAGSVFLPFGHALGNAVRALITGEVDGDAADELFVSYQDAAYDDFYAWLDWNGAAFQLSASLPVGGASDPLGVFVETVGDLDGDGDDDVAATTPNYKTVRVFPTVAGAPTYGATFPVPVQMWSVNHRLRAGDLDGDGDTDLVHLKMVATDPGPWIQAYEQAGGVLVQRHHLRLGDWDGDGWLDLFANGDFVDVVRSNGDWTFSEGFEAQGLGQAPGAGPLDADGDGRLDYVGTRTILFGDQTFADPYPPPEAGASTTYPDGLQPLDSEGDGDVDLRGGTFGAWRVNDGTGLFGLPQPASQDYFPPVPGPGFFWEKSVAYADLNGDGRRDYLTQLWFDFVGGDAFVEMHLLFDNGFGTFSDAGVAAPALVQIGAPGAAPDAFWECGDADGDGDQDVLVMNGYWRNNGGGCLEQLVPAYTGRAHGAADVDGDGDQDLLGTRDIGTVTQVLIFQGTPGGFSTVLLGTVPGDALARLVDLDQDGDQDAAAAAPTGTKLFLAENQGGAFPATATLDAIVENLRMLGVEDTDQDGLPDVLALRAEASGLPSPVHLITVYRRSGPAFEYDVKEEYLLLSLAYDGFIDADGDGDLDALGAKLRRGSRVDPPAGGVTRQYGTGFPGTAGVKPVLGAQGPATSTNPLAELRLVDAVGGGLAWLAFGLSEAAVPGVPLAGMTLYVGGAPAILGQLPLTGPPGVPTAGSLALPLPKIPGLVGLSIYHQAFVLDPGSALGWSATNGLEIQYGL